MTCLEVVLSILAGGSYVPRVKPDPGPDRAEGPGWLLGAAILLAAAIYVLIKLL